MNPKPTARSGQLSALPKVSNLITQIFSQFVPGYNVFSALLRDHLNIDADKALAVIGFFFGGWACWRYIKNVVLPLIWSNLTSSLVIEPDDKVFDDFIKWLSKQNVSRDARLIKLVGDSRNAGTNSYSRWYGSGEAPFSSTEQVDFSHIGVEDESRLFNFAASQARRPLRFEPSAGYSWFFHNRQLFILERYDSKNSAFSSMRSNADAVQLSCLGISTQPLKDLVHEARDANSGERVKRTTVWRPTANGGFSRENPWRKVTSRAVRAFESITLDSDQKSDLIKDVDKFIRPSRAKWYSSRGIPYRRGYLLQGPPGCGKTSVSYALAGAFGLDIFVITIGDDGRITEDVLTNLLSDLPSRCIVLLEDVDACTDNRGDSDDESDNGALLESAGKRRFRGNISLSGLLNAIDGVSSHEGHVLIMTTNYPERLDSALKRPGRVDKTIQFSLCKQPQIQEMFLCMYTDPTEDADPSDHLSDICRPAMAQLSERICPHMSFTSLTSAATTFAAAFPDNTFSPADIQGFLLLYRDRPTEAVADRTAEKARAELKERERRERMRKRREDRKVRMMGEAVSSFGFSNANLNAAAAGLGLPSGFGDVGSGLQSGAVGAQAGDADSAEKSMSTVEGAGAGVDASKDDTGVTLPDKVDASADAAAVTEESTDNH